VKTTGATDVILFRCLPDTVTRASRRGSDACEHSQARRRLSGLSTSHKKLQQKYTTSPRHWLIVISEPRAGVALGGAPLPISST
jgi:hypothetical protein